MLPLLLTLLAAPDAGVLLTRPVSLKAPRFSADNKAKRVVYWGGAQAQRGTMTLTCDRLEVEYDGADITRLIALGDVVVIDRDREAHGEQATFDNRTGVLVARGQPWARQGQREIEGETVTFTTGDDTLVVDKARTRGVEKKTGEVIIDADQLVQVKSKANWKGHVKAVRGPTTLTAPELEATWDAAGALTRLVASGGVEAVEPKRRAKGQRADYDLVKGVLVVTGHPEAHDQTSHMRGTKVTFFPDSDLTEIENAESVIDVPARKKKP